jgi:hypothetical protein
MPIIPGLAEIEVTNEVLAELGLPPVDLQKLHKRQPSAWFLKGPIPFEWLARANVAANTVVVAQIIKALTDIEGREPVTVPDTVWSLFKISRHARKRALDALERAGVVRTERLSGRVTRVWLIDNHDRPTVPCDPGAP